MNEHQPVTNIFAQFLEAMKDPEYSLLYVEPILIYGIGFGLITFLFASLVQEQKTQVFALVVLVASGMMISPYVNKRLATEKRIVAVYKIDYPERAGAYQKSTKNWRSASWIYYTMAVLGTLTLVVGIGKSKTSVTLSILTALMAIIGIFQASFAHYRESLDKYPTLRGHYVKSVDPPPPGPTILTNSGSITP